MDAEYHGSACPKYEALLEDLINCEANSAEAASLAEHMRECPGCRNAFKEAAAGARLLRYAEPTPDPGPGFAHVVMARIRAADAASESKSIWQPFVSMAWKFAATAAMGLAVLITVDATGHQTIQQDDAILARQADSRDLLSADPANPPRNADDVLMLMAETNHGQH
jgi:predicted anti-sigma-YlaC factor YlaD